MVKVEICIGSACYVKGSNQVVQIAQQLIAEKGWQEKVELKGSFCMQLCQYQKGLGIRVNGQVLEGVGLHNAKEELEKAISAAL